MAIRGAVRRIGVRVLVADMGQAGLGRLAGATSVELNVKVGKRAGFKPAPTGIRRGVKETPQASAGRSDGCESWRGTLGWGWLAGGEAAFEAVPGVVRGQRQVDRPVLLG